jgi:hypothetical protein
MLPEEQERVRAPANDHGTSLTANQHAAASANQHATPYGLRLSARRLATLGGSQHFSEPSRSVAASVEPTAAGNGTLCAAGSSSKREKLTC